MDQEFLVDQSIIASNERNERIRRQSMSLAEQDFQDATTQLDTLKKEMENKGKRIVHLKETGRPVPGEIELSFHDIGLAVRAKEAEVSALAEVFRKEQIKKKTDDAKKREKIFAENQKRIIDLKEKSKQSAHRTDNAIRELVNSYEEFNSSVMALLHEKIMSISVQNFPNRMLQDAISGTKLGKELELPGRWANKGTPLEQAMEKRIS